VKRLTISLIVATSLLLAACSNSPAPTPVTETASASTEAAVYHSMTIDEFAAILDAPTPAYTIVNVHIPYEGEIKNTDLFVSYNDLEALKAALPDKTAPIILYCRSGRMSDIAARALVDEGYTQVWDVPGGMNAWTSSGREVLEKE
jgi:rhodanese-related sulfurtransferase